MITKLSRNTPCRCGSGRKYKKCCEPKDLAAELAKTQTVPKNSFRDQLAKEHILETELIQRDAYVSYLRFKCQREMLATDRANLQVAIDKLTAYGKEIAKLPPSEGREACVEENQKHITELIKQRDASQLNRAQLVVFAVLEEKFGGQGINKKAVDEGTSQSEVVKPPPEPAAINEALSQAHDEWADAELVVSSGKNADENENDLDDEPDEEDAV